VLDTAAPGSTLPAASVTAPVTPDPPALLTLNGKLVVAGGGPGADAHVGEYSVATHQRVRGLGPVTFIKRWYPGWLFLRWVNGTGSVVLATDGGKTCALGHGQVWCLPASSVPLEFPDTLGLAW
jgi:hypothetical protein